MISDKKTTLEFDNFTTFAFGNGQIVRMFVWVSKERMVENTYNAPDCWAYFHPYEYKAQVNPDGSYAPIYQDEIGEIHFIAGYYGAGVVAHECAHACFQWAEENNIVPSTNNDEIFCTELGKMVMEFWKWHYSMLEQITGLS